MTATRIARVATLAAAAAAWAFGASLLWRTHVPDGLRLPHLSEGQVFGAGLVADAQSHERLIDYLWLGSTVAGLVALAVMARRGQRLVRELGLGRVNAGIVAGVVTLTVAWAASLPFALVGTWWERRHGISVESYPTAIATRWGQLLGSVIVAFVVLAIVLGLAQRLGNRWWAAALPVIVGLAFALQFVVPYLVTIGTHPLGPGRLASQISVLERREGAGDPPVLVDTVSGRTTAANAFSVGIGPTERMVLWDTLLDGRFSNSEVRFVAAHELAHLARDHVLKAMGWLFLFAVPVLSGAAIATAPRGGLRSPATVPLALLAIAVIQLALTPLQNAVSRRYESEADWIALGATRDPAAARGLFRRFTSTSLQDPAPAGWAHLFLDDHPTALTRVELAAAWRARNP